MNQVVKNFYRTLIKSGWTLNQIDEADIFFLFDLYSEEKQETVVYADDVPWL